MIALLHDAPVLEHDDAVRVADRREAVRDDERRPTAHQPLERFFDEVLALGVERARRLVEDQDARVLE